MHSSLTSQWVTVLLAVFVWPAWASAQQTIRGTILDAESQIPLIGAAIQVADSEPLLGSVTDLDGAFRLPNVELGFVTLLVSYVGYEPLVLPNVRVTAGKEVVLELTLTESIAQLTEAVVLASAGTDGKTNNELALVSARQLSVLESGRYAASISDPARQAQNFAGVSGGGDDLSNDIVVRGNSPRGMLWRLEGIEIPNPNHFGSLGASGGGVSMLSSNVLANSDFLTGAFPAEYGNAASGIFDLRFRRGNTEQHEYTLGAGLLGLEAAAEGPIGKPGGASFLVNYRYSTLSILGTIGVDVVGDLFPNYQDASIHVQVPTAKAGNFSFFALGGNNWYEDDYLDENFGSDPQRFLEEERSYTGVLGLKHRLVVGNKAYVHTTVSTSRTQLRGFEDLVQDGLREPEYNERSGTSSTRIAHLWNVKLNAQHSVRFGGIYSFLEEDYQLDLNPDSLYRRFITAAEQGQSQQAFVQWRFRVSEALTATAGSHYFRYGYTGRQSVEPRLGLRLQLSPKQNLSFGLGLHSRAESLLAYGATTRSSDNSIVRPNTSLGLTKAAHVVLGYDRQVGAHTRVKAETYFQQLSDVPVSSNPNSNFSALNARTAYAFIGRGDTLINEGTGRNYGVEFTLDRSLHEGLYFLATTSLYKAEFSTDGKQYFNGLFDGGYVANVLAGKEWTVGAEERNRLGVNLRGTLSGGLRFTAPDEAASQAAQELRFSETPLTEQLDAYYRFDLGLSYTINQAKSTQTFTLNVQNVINRLNEFDREFQYSVVRQAILTRSSKQAGIVPILKWVVQF